MMIPLLALHSDPERQTPVVSSPPTLTTQASWGKFTTWMGFNIILQIQIQVEIQMQMGEVHHLDRVQQPAPVLLQRRLPKGSEVEIGRERN